jgi:Vibrio phage DNA polymerase
VKSDNYRLAVFDTETDPQDYDGEYLPFVVGFFDGYSFRYFWDRNGKPGSCVLAFIDFLKTLRRPYLIYAHNGGKFDFLFLLDHIEQGMHIQNGRIVRCHIGVHQLRDSYSILPIPLSEFKGKHEKKKFEDQEEKRKFYQSKFNRQDRLSNKTEIVDYLRDDCTTLYEGVSRFREEFGDKLTIGSTSMSQLKKLHPFATSGQTYDRQFRPYYFGGRNEVFRSGILHGDYKVYDVNSMYPTVMRDVLHPISTEHEINIRITDKTTFALIEAKNYGCLPVRTATGLDFSVERGIFWASIHEIQAGLDTGTLQIIRVKHAIEHKERGTFADFVDTFYKKRMAARAVGDEMLVIFYKLILNSAYGKFAQNPENYHNYIITHDELPADVCQPHCQPDCPYHWKIYQTNGRHIIWCRPSNSKIFFNVATAASITAAARALLLRGLAASVDPIYCDTDSIICRQLKGDLDANKLGAWKTEGKGDAVAIAGKKMYAVFDGVNVIKQASKGALISSDAILELCKGGVVRINNPVPHFKFDGSHSFVTRQLKATAAPTKAPRRITR